MKIYSNPLFLQKIIKDNCGKQFENLFESDVILKFTKDEDDNLILNNLDGGTVHMDSTIAYLLSDYYKIVGNALKRIEVVTEQLPEVEYNESKGLGILFDEPFISFVNREFKLMHNTLNNSYPNDISLIEEDNLN